MLSRSVSFHTEAVVQFWPPSVVHLAVELGVETVHLVALKQAIPVPLSSPKPFLELQVAPPLMVCRSTGRVSPPVAKHAVTLGQSTRARGSGTLDGRSAHVS